MQQRKDSSAAAVMFRRGVVWVGRMEMAKDLRFETRGA
jgi:hypothetical protein